MTWLAGRTATSRALFEGTPTVLASDGVWDRHALHREGLRLADVDAGIRRQNARGVEDTASVVLEAGGALVVTMKPELQPTTRADLDRHRLEAKLDRLLAASPAAPG